MTDTMRAIVLDAPGPPDALTIRELPVPTPAAGWVLIEVKAFGLNRSELHTRQGFASGVTFPRVPGIEATVIVALDAQPEQSMLIRGGTSSVGMAAAVLAKQRNMTVLSTTRNASKTAALTDIGVDHVLIDDGNVARQVREILPAGVDNALELVGTPTLPDVRQRR